MLERSEDRNTGITSEGNRDTHAGFMDEKEKSSGSNTGSESGRDKTLERSGLSSGEERNQYIQSEPDTERLRSERQSVMDGQDREKE